jgi:hypothetical protein
VPVPPVGINLSLVFNIKVDEILFTPEWYAKGQFSFDRSAASWEAPGFVYGDRSACLVDNTGGPRVTGVAPGTCIVRVVARELLSTNPYEFGPKEVRYFQINVSGNTTTTTVPPTTTVPVVDVGTIELLVPDTQVVTRGEPVAISYRVHLPPSIDIYPAVSVSGDAAHAYTQSTTPSLEAASATSQTFRVVIQTWDLPLGAASFQAMALNRETNEWLDRINFTINVVPAELPGEWVGPTIEFLSVSAPTVTGRDTLTIRWRVTDSSGVEADAGGEPGWSTRFRALCGSGSSRTLSVLSHGQLVSGTVTNGEFKATFRVTEPRLEYLGSCDLHFYATDVWGNFTRRDADDAFVTTEVPAVAAAATSTNFSYEILWSDPGGTPRLEVFSCDAPPTIDGSKSYGVEGEEYTMRISPLESDLGLLNLRYMYPTYEERLPGGVSTTFTQQSFLNHIWVIRSAADDSCIEWFRFVND